MHDQGRPIGDAEPWFRKALVVFDTQDDRASKAMTLSNLASVLRADSVRLAEACTLAEQALVIKQTLDTGAAEIWKTYGILAEISTQLSDAEAARGYRGQARQSYAVAPNAREHLRSHRALILAVLVVLREPCIAPRSRRH
jgi:hypothetical protein